MIIVKLHGGLGNQMFQYAVGRALSLKNNDFLKMDLFWFGNVGDDIERPFKLNVFNVDIVEASDVEVKNIVPNKIFKKLGLYNHKKYIKEKHFHFDPEIIKLRGNVYLDGYWQSEKYFKDVKNVIRKDFELKNSLSDKAQASVDLIRRSIDNPISLHIRRGDYTQNPKTKAYHGLCSLDYYRKAIEYIKNKIGNIKLFVFSDDIKWAKEQELFNGAIFVSAPEIKDYEEMYLMSLCEHNIIANSSFSWWGAWLNKNQNKIVVAPKKWFNVPKDTSDLIPGDWIRI